MDTYWSQQEEKRLARMWCLEGSTQREIADELEKSTSSVQRAVARMGLLGEKGNIEAFVDLYDETVEPAIRPVRYEDTPVPSGEVLVGDDTITAIAWGDVHYPFQDDRAVNILYQITEELKPQELYCIGDVLDAFQLSSHRPPSERTIKPKDIDLQDDVDKSVAHLSAMLKLSEADRAIFMEGNHEERLDRMLYEIQTHPQSRHLLNMRKVKEVMSLDYLLGLDDMGWEFYKYVDEDPVVIRDRLVLTHGNKTTKWASRSELDMYGKSLLHGHTHRIQNWTTRNLKGQEAAWNIGCLTKLSAFYTSFSNWAQGFAVVTWSKIGEEWFFNIEQVRIHEGKTVFRNKVYTAD